MRKCAVQNCPNSDQTELCHRFPKNRCIAQKWQDALNLCHIPLDTLMSKFIICNKHFNSQDYRNLKSNCLNYNAIPQLRPTNPRKCSCHERVELEPQKVEREPQRVEREPQRVEREPQRVEREPQKVERKEEEGISPYNVIVNCSESPQESFDTFLISDEHNAADCCLMQSTVGAGFCMLDEDTSCSFLGLPVSKDLKPRNECGCCEDSHNLQPDCCCSDSDVEVIACEGMLESQSSDVLKLEHTDTGSMLSQCESDVCFKTNDLIDIDYEHLNKQQLIEIAKQQLKEIEKLTSQLKTLKSAQNTLIRHFQAFQETVAKEDNTQS